MFDKDYRLSQILENTKNKYPNKPAIKCGNIKFNYQEFYNRVQKLSNGILKLGVKQQDKIAIIHKNCHKFLESYFATAYSGTVLVPINYRLLTNDIEYIIENSDSVILISHPEFREKVIPIFEKNSGLKCIIWTERDNKILFDEKNLFYEDILTSAQQNKSNNFKISPNAPSHIYYTSGTTGKPKGVVLTHENNFIHADGTIDELNLNRNDRWFHISPMFHLADAWATWAITKVGGQHVMLSDFNPSKVLKTLDKEMMTLSNFIPTMLNILVNHHDAKNYEYSNLRLILSGGASIAPSVVEKIIKIFKCDYIQTYGMTETSPFLTMSILNENLKKLPYNDRFKYMVTTGRAFKTVHLKVVDEHGKDIKKNDKEVGEIIVTGETIFSGYWKLPEENKSRFQDGWFYTGDLARINSDGYLTIVDRKDDMIITGGENVYSIEVENVLYKNPFVLEAAVIGLPDDIWGESITGIVVLKNDGLNKMNEKEIIDFCKKYLPGFKVPKKIFFINELPKTGSRKISKKKLRELFC